MKRLDKASIAKNIHPDYQPPTPPPDTYVTGSSFCWYCGDSRINPIGGKIVIYKGYKQVHSARCEHCAHIPKEIHEAITYLLRLEFYGKKEANKFLEIRNLNADELTARIPMTAVNTNILHQKTLL